MHFTGVSNFSPQLSYFMSYLCQHMDCMILENGVGWFPAFLIRSFEIGSAISWGMLQFFSSLWLSNLQEFQPFLLLFKLCFLKLFEYILDDILSYCRYTKPFFQKRVCHF